MTERPISGEERQQMDKHEQAGFDVVRTHSGQKRPYGDTFREFTVKSDLSEEQVQYYCTNNVYPCHLHYDTWLADYRKKGSTATEYFRNSFKFNKVRDGEYFYQVIQPSTH